MDEIKEALEKNNTTEGRLSAVLGVADKLQKDKEKLIQALESILAFAPQGATHIRAIVNNVIQEVTNGGK